MWRSRMDQHNTVIETIKIVLHYPDDERESYAAARKTSLTKKGLTFNAKFKYRRLEQ